MIVGGTIASGSSRKAYKTYLKMVQNVRLTSFVPNIARVEHRRGGGGRPLANHEHRRTTDGCRAR